MKKTFFLLPMLLAMPISMLFVSCSSDDDEPNLHVVKYDIPLPGTTWLTWGTWGYDYDAYDSNADYLCFFNFNYDGTAQTISYERVGESDCFKKESVIEWSIRAADVPFMKNEYWTVDGYVYNVSGDKNNNYDYCGVRKLSRKGYDYELEWAKFGNETSVSHSVIKVNSLPTSDYIDYKGDNYVFNNNGGGGNNSGQEEIEEWVAVKTDGYLPYWYCPTDHTSGTKHRTSTIEAFKNTVTGRYKVKWAYKEYPAVRGYNKITIDTDYHTVYNSTYGYWSSCMDYFYLEVNILE